MLPEVRRHTIIRFLSETPDSAVSVTELAVRLYVSAMTIRRDLAWLEARGMVRRVRGGAVAAAHPLPERPFFERSIEFDNEKRAIGRTAAELVEDGDVIILDAGTTTLQVARHLGARRDVTVITNALPVAQELARSSDVTVVLLGGILKPEELCTVGPMVTRELGRLSADKVFLSAAGFDIRKGLTDPDIHEAEVKESMIQTAKRVILVADSSKWQHSALVRIAPAHAVHIWVTDDALSLEARTDLSDEGILTITPQTHPKVSEIPTGEMQA